MLFLLGKTNFPTETPKLTDTVITVGDLILISSKIHKCYMSQVFSFMKTQVKKAQSYLKFTEYFFSIFCQIHTKTIVFLSKFTFLKKRMAKFGVSCYQLQNLKSVPDSTIFCPIYDAYIKELEIKPWGLSCRIWDMEAEWRLNGGWMEVKWRLNGG